MQVARWCFSATVASRKTRHVACKLIDSWRTKHNVCTWRHGIQFVDTPVVFSKTQSAVIHVHKHKHIRTQQIWSSERTMSKQFKTHNSPENGIRCKVTGHNCSHMEHSKCRANCVRCVRCIKFHKHRMSFALSMCWTTVLRPPLISMERRTHTHTSQEFLCVFVWVYASRGVHKYHYYQR